MNRRVLAAAVTSVAAAVPFATTGTAAASTTPQPQVRSSVAVCSAARPGYAQCLSRVVANAHGKPLATSTPSGYGPADIRSAYKLTGTSSGGRTVAIVDAYNDPTAESDLATYRSAYGLSACTTANGCFQKVNQKGGTSYPKTDGGWAQEISLDLDMVSAACPDCHILLVEATTPSFANLGAAVNYAAGVSGVVAISNSYGGSDASDANYGSYYNHPGKAITVSSGDAGYGVEYPASSRYVVAVGGTSLRKASTSRGWTESAWSGAGSGCSSYNTKPSWQTSATSCSRRAVADVSAVADPNTGVAVYDSTAYQGASGWLVFGGTSAASPIVASVYALGGTHGYSYPAQYTWGHTSGLFDVTSGSNGSCSTTVWCHAGSGWDGPTGLGTPNGTTAF